MDGLLVVHKPPGLTSHDVVARVRRVLRERRIGHTGTLDPMATGVLPLVIGRATRLARFLSASDKAYEATVRLGFATDSGDATGRQLGTPFPGALPAGAAIEAALDAFRGTFMQQPPAFSAKKIGGTRSYTLARQAARDRAGKVDRPGGVDGAGGPGPPALPAPVSVTAHAIEVIGAVADTVTLRVHCTAGFYVRSLAHDLGERLAVGAHLTALCRTRSGEISLEQAIALSALEDPSQGAANALAALVPLDRMLPAFPAGVLTPDGMRRAVRGRDLRPDDFSAAVVAPDCGHSGAIHIRLVGPDGALVGMAETSATPGLLHPAIILV